MDFVFPNFYYTFSELVSFSITFPCSVREEVGLFQRTPKHLKKILKLVLGGCRGRSRF